MVVGATVIDTVLLGRTLVVEDGAMVVVLVFSVVVVVVCFVVLDFVVVTGLVYGQWPAAFCVRLVGVGVLGTLVDGGVPTVMVALPPPCWPSMTISMYS